jgi:predicted dehydrogenase
MRARVARGDIGRVLSVTGSYTQDWLLYPTDYNWRVEPDGGTNLRAVADIGTHWMDLAQFVVGEPIHSVLADLATFHPVRQALLERPSETFGDRPRDLATVSLPVTTEDYAAVLLRFDQGIRGAFHVSQANAGRKNRVSLEVAGTEAALSWDSETPNRLWIGRRNEPNQLLERDPALLSRSSAEFSDYPGGHVEGFPDTFKQLFRTVYEAIAADTQESSSYPTFEDGDHELRICEAIARSAREERWIEVGQ